MVTGNMKSELYNLKTKVQSLNRYLHSEVHGGKWSDDVGNSYLTYTENLIRIVDSLESGVNSAESIEKFLDSVDERVDKSKLSELKSAVRNL